jgi:hypothetical protein
MSQDKTIVQILTSKADSNANTKFKKIDGTRGKMCQIWRSIPTYMCVQMIPVKLQLQVGEGRHKGLYIVDFTYPTFSTTIKWIS